MPLESPNIGPVDTIAKPPSGFAPLKIPLFRDRWIASTISSVGTWMQDTAGTWLMTSLTTSPFLIALMQTAASLPVLLLGLLAGATADIFDRRKLLIFWQAWMLASVGVLAVLTFIGYVSPWTLLAFTFLLNIGSAMNNPAWQAIVPELVPRELIPDTVSLNAASNNLARAVGPALGGLMVAGFQKVYAGAGSVFALNALSFAGVIWVLVNWKRIPLFKSTLPSERIAGSIRSGLRYVRYAPDLQSSLVRAFIYTFFISAIWSLLAVVAKRDLKQGPLGYGILNGHRRHNASSHSATILCRPDSGRVDPLQRRCSAGARVRAQPLDHHRHTYLLRRSMDQYYVNHQRLCSAFSSRLGTSARIGHLHDYVSGRHGLRRDPVGLHCRTHIHANRSDYSSVRFAHNVPVRTPLPYPARSAA
jgi:hypothetical protein